MSERNTNETPGMLHESIEVLKQSRSGLLNEVKSFADGFDTDSFPQRSDVEKLTAAADSYLRALEECRLLSSRFFKEEYATLTEIEDAYQRHLEKYALLSDYLKLTVTDSDYSAALEESKNSLQAIAAEGKEIPEGYLLILRKANGTVEKITDEQFDAIERTVSKKMARAADRGAVVLPDKMPDSEPENPWDSYTGYISHVQIHGANFKPEPLKANDFIVTLNQKRKAAAVLLWLANRKLVEEKEYGEKLNSEAFKELLENGYFERLTVETENETRKFITLSAKGWDCYTTKKTAERLKERGCMLPRAFMIAGDELKKDGVQEYIEINDYIKTLGNSVYPVLFQRDGLILAAATDDGGENHIICTGLMIPGTEEEKMQKICCMIKDFETYERITVIVQSENDAEILKDMMKKETADFRTENVVFAVKDDGYKTRSYGEQAAV